MVHWPDNMVTYSDVDQILFSNDAFGQHYATTKRFDDENDLSNHEAGQEVLRQHRVAVRHAGAQGARGGQGPRAQDDRPQPRLHLALHIDKILEKYEAWTTYQTEEKAVVIFDSMWHSTEMMAREICDSFIAEGISAKLIDVKASHISDIMTDLCDARYVAVGSPTPQFQHAAHRRQLPHLHARPVAQERPAHRSGIWLLWLGPAWPQAGVEKLEKAKFNLPVPVITQQWIPSEENLAELQAAVKKIIEDARA